MNPSSISLFPSAPSVSALPKSVLLSVSCRLLFVCIPCLALMEQRTAAQTTITYSDGDTDATAYDTSAPNDPTTVSIASGAATQSGAITGDGALIKTGAGTLTLTGANTFTGAVSVNGGTLLADGDGALGGGDVTVDDTAGQDATLGIGPGVSIGNSVTLAHGGSFINDGTLAVLAPFSHGVSGGTGAAGGDGSGDAGGSGGAGSAGDTGGYGVAATDGGSTLSNDSTASITGSDGSDGGAGGAGGRGGSSATAGGAGGNGGDGGHGGTGGAGVALVGTNHALTNDGVIDGGAGGGGGGGAIGGQGGDGESIESTGGHGGYGGRGGEGGTGGAGVAIVGSQTLLTNNGVISGGDGGDGSSGGGGGAGGAGHDNGSRGGDGGDAGEGGRGGVGGAGVVIVGTGDTVVNTGGIYGGFGGIGDLGGSGGAGGSGFGPSDSGAPGASGDNGGIGLGGVAVAATGSNSTVINDGVIEGGLGGDGLTRADAIDLSGSGGTLEIRSGSLITGNVVASGGSNHLVLGGDTSAAFDVSGIGDAAQYRRFDFYAKTGASTWTLTGATTATTAWTITGGTLSVSADANLGDASGGLLLDGGTLKVTGAGFTMNRTTTLGTGGGAFDIADATGALIQQGVISGGGALTKTGAGALTLTGDNTYTGDTHLEAGTLIAGSDTAFGTGRLTIEAGATLGGVATDDAAEDRILANAITVHGDFSIDPDPTYYNIILNGDIDLGGATRVITTLQERLTKGEEGEIHLNGVISNGGLTFAQPVAPPERNQAFITLGGSSANTYTGDTTVGPGVYLILEKDANVTAIPGDLVLNGGSQSGQLAQVSVHNDGQIADTATVTLNGLGQLVLADSVSETIATLRDDGSGEAGIYLYEGSTLTVSDGSFSGAIHDGTADTVVLVKQGTGTLTLSGASDYVGITAIDGGVLSVSDDANLGDASGGLLLDGGTLQVTGTGFTMNRATDLDAHSGGTFDIADATGALTQQGVISGGGSLTKTGAGTLTLTGANTYTGAAIVNDGLLIVASDGALGNSIYADAASASGAGSTIQVNAGVTLGKGLSFNDGATLDNRGSVTGLLGVTSAGAAGGTLLNTGSITGTGSDAVYIQDGFGSVTNTGGTLTAQQGNGVWLRSGGEVINQGGGSISGSSDWDGIWVEGGSGQVKNLAASTITGSYNGVTLVEGGSVTNSGGSTIQTSGTGGENGIQGSDAAATVQNLDTSVISGRKRGVWLDNGGSVLNEGVITGAQVTGPTNAGVYFSSVAASLVNKGTINGGVLMDDDLAHAATLYSGSVINGALDLGANTAATLTLAGDGDQLYSDAVTGATTFAGVLTKQGTGAWTLDAVLADVSRTGLDEGRLLVNGTLGGALTVASGATLGGSGTLTGAVTVADGGAIAPGNSPGTLTVGSLTLDSGSFLDFQLGDPAGVAGADSDLIRVNGDLTLDGLLRVAPLTGFGAGDYRLIDYTGALTDNGLLLSASVAWDYTVDTATTGQVNLGVAAATAQYWDGPYTAPQGAAGGSGGDGTWDAATANWTDSAGNNNGAWTGDLAAIFGGTAGAVTIADGFTASAPGLSFLTGGYVLAADGSGALELTGPARVEVASGLSAEISAPVTGTAGFDKIGAGTLILSGANAWTGVTTVGEGTLRLGSDDALPGSADLVIDTGATLDANNHDLTLNTLSGAGTLAFGGTGGAIYVETAGAFAGALTGGTAGVASFGFDGAGAFTLGGDSTFAGDLYVGNSAGKLVSSGDSTFGGIYVDHGEFQVDGGSATAGSYVYVSAADTARLSVTGGGTLHAADLLIASNAGESGAVSVAGAGSELKADGFFYVSDSGAGTLLLADGAKATADDGHGTVQLSASSGGAGTLSIGAASGDPAAAPGIVNAGRVTTGAGAGTLVFNHTGADYHFTTDGAATGAGVVIAGRTAVVQEAGYTIFTADNTYTGGTTVSGGTLQIGDGGTTGSLTGDVTNDAALVFDRSDATTCDSDITGTGTLTKTGAGALTLTGDSDYTGTTQLDAGALLVNGSLGATAVTVADGALLGGSGTIAGGVTVQSGGILSPGDSPGILTVGSLTLESGSTTRMDIGGAGTAGVDYDQIHVTGQAALGGTLELLPSGYAPKNGDTFTLIRSDGGITGDFTAVNGLGNALVFTTAITDDYTLTITAVQTDFAGFAETPNQQSVAQNLDDDWSDPALSDVVTYLDSLPGTALPAAFDQIAPTSYTALPGIAQAGARALWNSLGSRLAEVRAGSTGWSTAGLNLTDRTGPLLAAVGDTGDALSRDILAAKQADAAAPRRGFFVSGAGTFGGEDSGSVPGFDFATGSLLLGADTNPVPDLALGLLAGYDHTRAEPDAGGSIDADTARLGLYGTWSAVDGGWLNAAAGGACHWYDTRRPGLGGTATAGPRAAELNALLQAGRDYTSGPWTLTPGAGVSYLHLRVDGFTESGSLAPLSVEAQDADSLRSELTLTLARRIQTKKAAWSAWAKAGWAHEFLDTRATVSSRLASGAGGVFSVQGNRVPRDGVLFAAGLRAAFGKTLSASVAYSGDYNADFLSHSISASASLRF